jgi:ABC-2 type transport system permease protein
VPLHGLPAYLGVAARIMPLRYAVDLNRAAFYTGSAGYGRVVIEGPLIDATVVGGLFVVLFVAGALVFSYRERSR